MSLQGTVVRPVARSGTSPKRLSLHLPHGWPLIASFWLYPVWWAMGVPFLAFPVGAGLTILSMTRTRPRLMLPRWGGLWILFLAWTLVSAVSLRALDRAAAWGFRDLSYFGAFLVLLVLANMPAPRLPSSRIARMILALWVASVVGGVLGVLLPHVDFTSPTELVLPHGISHQPFIYSLVHPGFGELSSLYDVPRPRTLYSFSNEWGAAMGLLTPMALYSRTYIKTQWARTCFWTLLAVSVVPIVLSVNRGLWVSLAVAAVVVLVQAGRHGRAQVVAGLVLTGSISGTALWFSPLHTLIQSRVGLTNVGTRQTLATGAVDYATQSPLIGYGAPVQSDLATGGLSVGTHGQLWTLLVSHGIPGAILYVAFFSMVLLTFRHVSSNAWWLQATLVVLLIQLPIYNAVGVPVTVAMVAVILLMREETRMPPKSSKGIRSITVAAPAMVNPESEARRGP